MSEPHWTLRLETSPTLYLWSGSGPLDQGDGIIYQGTGQVMAVRHDSTLGDPRDSVETQIMLRVDEADLREDLLLASDPIAATVTWINLPKGIQDPPDTLYSVSGFLSAPSIAGGVYTATIDTFSHEVSRRARIQYWSYLAQRQRYVNDAGMDAMKDFGEGFEIAWPR